MDGAITGVIARLRPRLLGGVLVYDRTVPATPDDLEVIRTRKDELIAWLKGERPEAFDTQAAIDAFNEAHPPERPVELREYAVIEDGHGGGLVMLRDELDLLQRTFAGLRAMRERQKEPCPNCQSKSHQACDGTGRHHGKLICADCGRFIRWLKKEEAKRLGVRRREGEWEFDTQEADDDEHGD